jgi:hypothetical protein
MRTFVIEPFRKGAKNPQVWCVVDLFAWGGPKRLLRVHSKEGAQRFADAFEAAGHPRFNQ